MVGVQWKNLLYSCCWFIIHNLFRLCLPSTRKKRSSSLFNFPLIFQKGRHVCYVSFYYHNLIITELKLSCLISWFLFLIWNSSSTRIGHLNQELCRYSYSILNRLGGIFLQYMNISTRANFAANCCDGDLLYTRNTLMLLLLSLFWQKILFRWL